MVLGDKGWIPVSFIRAVILSFSLWACKQVTESSSGIMIQWNDSAPTGIIIPYEILGNIVPDSAAELVTIHVVGAADLPPVFGDYNASDDALIFQPLIPFTRGLSYDVRFRNRLVKTIQIPSADSSLGPKVLALYPGSDTVPENLLKVYVEFSRPMREANPLEYVVLMCGADTVRGAFLDLHPALWNQEGTLLTLWLDPGRIKRALQPNEALGAPLENGKSYRIVINSGWPGKNGVPLAKPFEKPFIAGARDNTSPSTETWQIELPVGRSRDRLYVDLREPMDFVLLQETIRVVDASGGPVSGKIETTDEETGITFVPQDTWREGAYFLECEPRLEDLAGNNLSRLFDEDVTVKKTRSTAEAYKVPFKIK